MHRLAKGLDTNVWAYDKIESAFEVEGKKKWLFVAHFSGYPSRYESMIREMRRDEYVDFPIRSIMSTIPGTMRVAKDDIRRYASENHLTISEIRSSALPG